MFLPYNLYAVNLCSLLDSGAESVLVGFNRDSLEVGRQFLNGNLNHDTGRAFLLGDFEFTSGDAFLVGHGEVVGKVLLQPVQRSHDSVLPTLHLLEFVFQALLEQVEILDKLCVIF